MLEEDIVLLFSANESFVDLIVTFDLEIEYDGNQEEIDDRSHNEGNGMEVPHHHGGVEAEDKEEGGGSSQAGLSTPVVEVQDGQADGDSEEDECEAAPDCPVRTLFD